MKHEKHPKYVTLGYWMIPVIGAPPEVIRAELRIHTGALDENATEEYARRVEAAVIAAGLCEEE